MKRMFQIALVIVLIPVLYVVAMLLYGMLTEFKPAAEEKLTSTDNSTRKISASDSSLSFLIWNIGYGGLGAGADFFYDGGKMVRSPEELVKKYTKGIVDFTASQSDVDFLLFQEVDCGSKRSWNINHANRLALALPQHNSVYAMNYRVRYLPFPWTEPMGKINSGLQTASRFDDESSTRISLPGITDWPRKLFYLKRCLLQQRYALPNGKELIVINAHFEAYDKGEVKAQQRALTKKILDGEFAKGNYVVVGGDWNIAPPDFNVQKWAKEKESDALYSANLEKDFMPGWTLAYDSTTATNRKNVTAYDPAKTYTTVIDYFLVSPNVTVEEVRGVDLKFADSDHQPVRMRVRLK